MLAHLLLVASTQALHVAIAGATGRTGRLIVDELVAHGHAVTALVRDPAAAKEVLPPTVQIECVDFADAKGGVMRRACASADRLIWAASGFTESGESIDNCGMALLPYLDNLWRGASDAPSVVFLSSAGVTRTSWDEGKKERLLGASDIPIIRLNPGGILEQKCKAEQALRESGLPYVVVRPTGLKFEGWPSGRPVLSQGDVAVGRTNPTDLAAHLVALLEEPTAAGRTYEYFTLAGYPPPRELSPLLERLTPDAAGALDESAVDATYHALQQLLPGEEQDATKLEMGRTYEQLDAGVVVPRERGAAPTDRERQLAAGVAGGRGSRVGRLFGRVFRR